MRRAPLPTLLLAVLPTLASPAARAEDFSGFYGGLNAGYAREHERETGVVGVPSPGGLSRTDGGASGSGLPPSAAGAAAALRGTRHPETRASRTR